MLGFSAAEKSEKEEGILSESISPVRQAGFGSYDDNEGESRSSEIGWTRGSRSGIRSMVIATPERSRDLILSRLRFTHLSRSRSARACACTELLEVKRHDLRSYAISSYV